MLLPHDGICHAVSLVVVLCGVSQGAGISYFLADPELGDIYNNGLCGKDHRPGVAHFRGLCLFTSDGINISELLKNPVRVAAAMWGFCRPQAVF